jgi:hypothetical protein
VNGFADENSSGGKVCLDLAGKVVDWSDVSAFIYFGARVDAGFPFNKHREEDTGSWVGPLNVIMAKGTIPSPKAGDKQVIVDRYLSRYVNSPLTPHLKMPENCTLLSKDDFNKVAGPIAVNSTTKGQYDPNRTDENSDPYQKYLNTCDNGDVQPLLPLIQFDFEKDLESQQESIQVKLDYKFLSMPSKSDYMYSLFPMVQRRFNKADLGFHISGPYCYGNDPKRGYTFDMNFDTRDPKAMLTLTHGCIDGLPCTPPAASLWQAQAGASKIHVKPNVIPSNGGATIDVGSSIGLIFLNFVLVTLLITSCFYNCKLRRQLKRSSNDDGLGEQSYGVDGHHGDHDNVGEIYDRLEDEEEVNFVESDTLKTEHDDDDKAKSTTPLLSSDSELL